MERESDTCREREREIQARSMRTLLETPEIGGRDRVSERERMESERASERASEREREREKHA
eukprot:1097807-Rhodomonas_salina.2